MKRVSVIAFALLVAWAVPRLASPQADHSENSRKAEFQLASATVVGTQTLKAGTYRFQCKLIDGQHYMVVTSESNGQEVSRVPCTPEALASKTKISEFRTIPRGAENVLSSVRFAGESIAHRIVAN
jgi:hypothetical protein